MPAHLETSPRQSREQAYDTRLELELPSARNVDEVVAAYMALPDKITTAVDANVSQMLDLDRNAGEGHTLRIDLKGIEDWERAASGSTPDFRPALADMVRQAVQDREPRVTAVEVRYPSPSFDQTLDLGLTPIDTPGHALAKLMALPSMIKPMVEGHVSPLADMDLAGGQRDYSIQLRVHGADQWKAMIGEKDWDRTAGALREVFESSVKESDPRITKVAVDLK